MLLKAFAVRARLVPTSVALTHRTHFVGKGRNGNNGGTGKLGGLQVANKPVSR